MKRVVLLFTAVFMLAVAANAQGIAIGAKLENFSLPDTDGKVQTLSGLKGKNGAVVIFLSAQCPVVKGYKDRINAAAEEAKAKGINFIGINSNSTESLDWVKSNMAEFGYKFPMLIDKGNKLADKLDAQATPEVYFVGADDTLLYRGAIDNDRAGSNISEKYLNAAWDSSLAGKPIAKNSVKAFGCTIKRVGM
jgi:peroxiredoxin